MSGHWEYPNNPEAEEKYIIYNDALSKLKTYKTNIDNKITSSFLPPKLTAKDSAIVGGYYDLYKQKVDDWHDEVDNIKDAFLIFLTDLSNCISHVNSEVIKYDNLRKYKEWVEDARLPIDKYYK